MVQQVIKDFLLEQAIKVDIPLLRDMTEELQEVILLPAVVVVQAP